LRGPSGLRRLIAAHHGMPGRQHRHYQHQTNLEDQGLRPVVGGQDSACDHEHTESDPRNDAKSSRHRLDDSPVVGGLADSGYQTAHDDQATDPYGGAKDM